jgi:hypothetical protein
MGSSQGVVSYGVRRRRFALPADSKEAALLTGQAILGSPGYVAYTLTAVGSLPKNFSAVAQVVTLNSSSEQAFTWAATSDISFTYAGSQRLPR